MKVRRDGRVKVLDFGLARSVATTRDYRIGTGITFAQYDVGKDGRFLMIKRATETGRLNVVLNWRSELAKLTQSR